MSKPGVRDQSKCKLCPHGPACIERSKRACGFAHHLDQLRHPYEHYTDLRKVWSDGVHRWYGQEITKGSLRLIQWYYYLTPKCERPVWATGCLWFHGLLPPDASIENLPYDFGIYQDWQDVSMHPPSWELPFRFAPHLHARIQARHDCMIEPHFNNDRAGMCRVPVSPSRVRSSLSSSEQFVFIPAFAFVF